jgi:AcrR family transcriptional regulator
MTKEETQRKIIEKAFELIGKHGYNKVSARKIAREVGISVSTLFYHFPEGLIDILAKSVGFFTEKLKLKEIFLDGEISDKEIKEFFLRQLKISHEMKDLSFALESALLADPEHFKDKAKRVNKTDHEEFLMIKKIYDKIIGRELKISMFSKLISIWKGLLRRHIIFDNLYGSDEEFINMMFKIFHAVASEE